MVQSFSERALPRKTIPKERLRSLSLRTRGDPSSQHNRVHRPSSLETLQHQHTPTDSQRVQTQQGANTPPNTGPLHNTRRSAAGGIQTETQSPTTVNKSADYVNKAANRHYEFFFRDPLPFSTCADIDSGSQLSAWLVPNICWLGRMTHNITNVPVSTDWMLLECSRRYHNQNI
ncbi:hypothetical protein EYF80_046342 [Liparis tanakae]|uniref:Uncharacterized protein n=1 Tax=Liparis tanakae TaxID=230148 RepID=A0A4Z2FRW5_9TELE|nr:hypothetical protein EYF80_046342 [Liparis tanakae]